MPDIDLGGDGTAGTAQVWDSASGTALQSLPHRLTIQDDPFQTLDTESVGQLVRIETESGHSTRPKLMVGICGEHGGDPASIEFCYKTGLNYVSCSAFRVPVARLAAAQASIKAELS